MQGNNRDQTALATLRRRIAEVEETNGDLIAYARGHAGAAHAIHEAVLAALEATTPAMLATIVTCDWPNLLGVEAAALAWSTEEGAFAADTAGVRPIERRLVSRMAGLDRAVTVRAVDRGHPLFGASADAIRGEIQIRLSGARGLGLILLGERTPPGVDGAVAGRLLRFLGRTVSVMLERWPIA